MSSRTITPIPLLATDHLKTLFDTDPTALTCISIQAAGGHGKSAVLRELSRRAEAAGLTDVLLIDDAHLLDEARLRELQAIVEAGTQRLIVTCRPWPRPAALADLMEAVRRRGQAVVLGPFSERQTAEYLAAATGKEPSLAMVRLVYGQTAGVPRFVARLAQSGPFEVPPPSAVLQFGPDMEELHDDLRRLLLAVAVGAEAPHATEEILAAAKATGLLGADNTMPPLARRAVISLSHATFRDEVWQQLTEQQLLRGGPLLPLVRALFEAGVSSAYLAEAFEMAAGEALSDEPALAAELFAAAAATGRPATARRAQAAALCGDVDFALRLADRLISAEDPADRAGGAAAAATALAHRGQLTRSAELYRWSGTSSSAAFAAIASAGTGFSDELERLFDQPSPSTPPTLLTSASKQMARGVRETLSGSPTAALSAFVQATALLEPAGQAVLLPDSPAAMAALVALHCGELDIADSVLDGAIASRMGAALMARRHRLLQAWILMARGKTADASERLVAASAGSAPLEPRDLLFAAALEVGIARRNSDLPALQRAWRRAREAVVRHPVDLYTLLPLGEFAIAAARLGELSRLHTHLWEARLLLDRLGNPVLWATPLHWSSFHAALITEELTVAEEHAAALHAARHIPLGAAFADAAGRWLEITRGVVWPVEVETAARGLHHIGLCWDAARLAGQAAIRTSDRRAMTALLECARVLQGRATDPLSVEGPGRLSDREQEVADLVLAGMTYKQIADQLFISAKTVEHHVARMRQRLNCSSRSELLARLRSMAAEKPRVPSPRPPSG